MAKCKWCERGGLFRSVDQNGLCSDCHYIYEEAAGRMRVMKESSRLAQEGKTFATRLGRFDLMIEHAEYLLQFERKGIRTVTPQPSRLLSEAQGAREQIVAEEANSIVTKAIQKAELARTPAARERALANAILKVREVAGKASYDASAVATEERQLKHELHRVKLEGHLEAARKAEFKGNTKKAIDQYQEALYFIRNDEIDDTRQQAQITELEAKLDELQAAQEAD